MTHGKENICWHYIPYGIDNIYGYYIPYYIENTCYYRLDSWRHGILG